MLSGEGGLALGATGAGEETKYQVGSRKWEVGSRRTADSRIVGPRCQIEFLKSINHEITQSPNSLERRCLFFQILRSFAEFTLSPFTLFRAVRKWRANGLRMTTQKLCRDLAF